MYIRVYSMSAWRLQWKSRRHCHRCRFCCRRHHHHHLPSAFYSLAPFPHAIATAAAVSTTSLHRYFVSLISNSRDKRIFHACFARLHHVLRFFNSMLSLSLSLAFSVCNGRLFGLVVGPLCARTKFSLFCSHSSKYAQLLRHGCR